MLFFFFFSSRRRHTRWTGDWSSDVCSSDLGFFQPGEDVNYIAMSLDPRESDPYSIAFHEYVHLHLRDNVPQAPVWLNEGLRSEERRVGKECRSRGSRGH